MFLFFTSGGAKGTGGQVQGTALCFGGIPTGVMCLKSITPIARISVCAEKESVCLFPLKT